MLHAGRNGEHSWMENFHGDDIYPHNINMNKHSCTYQSLPEHQVSKLCKYLTKMHIKSYKHMEGLNTFSNYVKTTLNLGSSLKEVDWRGNIDPNYTSSECMLMEVDWGCKLKLNYTSCGCMLVEVDWGGKLIVNSMVNWGAHETHQNEHTTTRVHWGDHDQARIRWMNTASLKLIGEPMTQVTFSILVYIDLDAKPKDFFTQELWGGLPQRTSSTPLIGLNHVEGKLVHHLALQKGPNRLDHQLDQQWDPTKSLDHLLSSSDPDLCPSLSHSLAITVLLVGNSYYLLMKMGRNLTSTSLMAYLKYSFDIEDGFSISKSIKQYGSSYTLPDLEQHESSYNLLTQWDPGEKPLQPPLCRKAIATKIINFLWIQSEYHLSCMLSKHWELIKIFPLLQKLLITNDLFLRSQGQQRRKQQEKATKETPMSSKKMGYPHHTLKISIIYTQIYIYIYIYT